MKVGLFLGMCHIFLISRGLQKHSLLMVTDETSDETEVNNLPVQGKPSVFPVCDFTFFSYSPYFLKICWNRNDSLKQQAKLCLCEDWLC